MFKPILLFLTAVFMARTVKTAYHVLVADKRHEHADGERSFLTHFRSRRSLTDPDDILTSLINADGSGSEDEDNVITSREQTFQFYVKNNDTENSASMHLSELMPGNAILTEFVVYNEAQTYRYNDVNVKDKEQAEREYEESAKAGASTVMVGNVQSTNHRCSDCRSEDFDGQTVSAVINVAPGDVLSISLSYVVPISVSSAEYEKDLYRTDVTISLEESAKKMTAVIMSPNYPEPYPNNADVTYLIEGPIDGMSISASIVSFDSESCCDHLYIFDGATDTSPVLAVVSGNVFSTDPIVSSGSRMLLKFQTDFIVNSGGFAMQFFPVDVEIFSNKLPMNETYVINQNRGVVESPGYPKSYPPSSVLNWTITSDPKTKLRLEIYDFDVLPGEMLQIFDGITGNILETLTESDSKIYQTIAAQGNKVFIVFTSVQKILFRRGFYFEYNSDLPHNSCSSNIYLSSKNDDWKSLESPNYPNNYENNANCLWVISAPGTNVVQIEMESMSLESAFDTLQVFDGNGTEESSVMGELSGIGGKGIKYVSSSNAMSILFTSDESVTDSGFEIKYKVYHVCEDCYSTPRTIDSSTGLFKNPDWPSSTSYYSDCQWVISVTPGSVIEVQLGNYYGYYSNLKFYNDGSIYGGILWSTGGNSYYYSSDISFRSSTNQMLVVLDNSYSGYSVRYLFTFMETTVDRICDEQNLLTTSPGVIMSPYYPLYYPSDINCQWLIQGTSTSYVELEIEIIELGYYDVVWFYNGESASSPSNRCERYYTCYEGQTIFSTSSAMRIVANTYSSDGFFKFAYSFASDSLITENDEYSGYANSLNYPLSYPNYYDHTYYISVASDYIQFYFEHFDTESCCDYLYVYDGSSTSSTRIASLSGNQNGFSGQTSGTFLTMRFSTDSSVTDKGFYMKYCSPGYCDSDNQNEISTSLNPAHSYLYVDDVNVDHFFSSPEENGAYPNNEDFYWYIECGIASSVRYYFYRLDIDSSDFVKVYQNFGTNSNLLEENISGVNYYYSIHSVSVSSATSTVWFHSDSEFTGRGFYVKFECYN